VPKGPAQIEQNVKAIAWNLSAEEMAEIDKIMFR
jgi:aryl-alcohol dehydrogenase-like predicted oxidoreductase